MALIIIGIILFLVAVAMRKQADPLPRVGHGLKIASYIVILLGIFTSCIKQIDTGEVGVKSMFGKVQPDILTSGLNVVNPLVDVQSLDVKTQNYTMSGVHDEGEKAGDDAIRALTADGLEVVIDLTVLYHIVPSEAPRLVRETGID